MLGFEILVQTLQCTIVLLKTQIKQISLAMAYFYQISQLAMSVTASTPRTRQHKPL